MSRATARRTRPLLLGALALVAASLNAPSPAAGASPPLPAYVSVPADVKQMVTVTSTTGWDATRASLSAWRRRSDGWHRVHGPVTVRLGYSGWAVASKRRQSTGTTPAGKFTMPSAFGNRTDPGARLRYRHVDGNDVWPYEPRDPATYNIYQPFQSGTSHWRSDYREKLSSYPTEYAYAVVLGFNLPSGVHWSTTRHQWIADHPADTSRGGGIFLHVQQHRYTAGCVAGPLDDIRWVVRWLDPALHPRIVMGPREWVKKNL